MASFEKKKKDVLALPAAFDLRFGRACQRPTNTLYRRRAAQYCGVVPPPPLSHSLASPIEACPSCADDPSQAARNAIEIRLVIPKKKIKKKKLNLLHLSIFIPAARIQLSLIV